LKIETFELEDHRKKITAEFDMDTLERFKHQAARKISQEVKIPGFRPGKAPYDMVRRLYGDKAIQEEAVNLMLEDLYPEVIKESKINPYGPGKLEEITSVDPPKFTFIVPLTPEVELGDYKAMREDYVTPVVTDEKVDDTIERLQRRAGTAEPVERPAQAGDLVAIKLSSRLIQPDEGQEPVLIDESNQEMVAGKPEEHMDDEGHEWPYPGFANELVGLSAGDKKVFKYTFSDDGSARKRSLMSRLRA